MSDPFIGEIRMFAGNFPPVGWARCDGQLMPISQNDALFALIGTTYGGDGVNTFGLPDLRGRVPVHQGQGPRLGNWVIGESIGAETVTLTSNQLPAHAHAEQATSNTATAASGPSAAPGVASTALYGSGVIDMPLASAAVASAGSGLPHDNLAPFTALTFIISLFGVFPSRS